MKKFQTILLPAVIAGVASLLATGLASADNVFVVNNGGNTISEISNGVVSTFIATDLNGPTGIAINSAGDFFVDNNGNNGYIEEYSPTGVPIGQYSTGENNPRGLAFDSAGNLDVAVQGTHQILQIPVGGGSGTILASGFSAINGVGFSGGTLYATDGGAGAVDTVTGSTPTTYVNGLSSPNGIAFDSAGDMFLVEHGSSTIAEIPFGSTTASAFITQTSAQGPKDVAIDSSGDFFITDNSNNTFTQYSPTGVLIATFAGSSFNGPCFVVTQAAVPEPSTYALMLAGLGLLYFRNRRKLATLRI